MLFASVFVLISLTPIFPIQVESAMAERGQLEGSGGGLIAGMASGLGEEGDARLGEMQQEIDVSGAELPCGRANVLM